MTNLNALLSRHCQVRHWIKQCLTALAALVISVSAYAQSCGPVPGGNPNKSGQCAGAGNPINVMSGNKYQREEDMPALPGVLGLELVRHYNSAFSGPGQPNGVLGRGWRLSYETELVDRWGKVQVLEADGGRVIFDRNPRAPTGCSTADPGNGTMAIRRQQDGRLDYIWTWTDGRKLHFNSAGKLDRITAATGEVLQLMYDSQNVLVKVIDPQGRALNFVYFDRRTPNQFHGVQFIDTPVGRFSYEYVRNPPKDTGLFDQRQLLATLVRVRLPDQFAPDKKAHPLSSRGTTISMSSRIYHHEDPRSPWLMTGISIESTGADGKLVSTRYSTFGYDDTGRAILSMHAGNVDKVTLDNHEAGRTVITNSLGQKTVYRYTVIGGEYRLLEVRGAGCALCGEPNLRYRYDSAGRLIEATKLYETGDPFKTVKIERDKLGRVIRLSKTAYVHGKPGPIQLQVRFEYLGNSFAPALVAHPSVVAGKELLTRFVYNDAGQPLSISETGWSPAADAKLAATRIERTVRFRYAIINGRSLLTEIDGPLPNGKTNTPFDSDITKIEYDHRSNPLASPRSTVSADRLDQYDGLKGNSGTLTAITGPGGRKNEVEYDYAGRIGLVKGADGHSTRLSYSPRGQLLAISADGITYTTHFDALGNPDELGYDDGGRYHALKRLGYDDAGRNIWIASALGIAWTNRFNTEDALLERHTLSSTIDQTRRYQYDDLGHLIALTDASGGTRRVSWTPLGLPAALTDASGRTTRFGYDAAGNITSVTQPDGAETGFELDLHNRTTAVVGQNGATTRYVRDDFGRTVATSGADSGKTTRRFDEADRLVSSSDANGNRVNFEYDVMGHIISQRVIDAKNDGKTTVTTWRYDGNRLVAIYHPNQDEHYSYDAQGRIASKTISLLTSNAKRVGYTMHYRYDHLGQLIGTTLPDSSTLDYRRNGQNQITALERTPAASQSLKWLVPRQTIVRDVERDIIGLRHLTYGNDIEAYYQRSKEGSLARVVYRDSHMPMPGTVNRGVLESLFGIKPARAAPRPSLPGAMGLPSDPKALIDHRYLWDTQGNLLYTRDKDGHSSYAYDARDRMIVVATAAARTAAPATVSPSTRFDRYYYDDNGNRLLAQEGLSDQSDVRGNLVKTSYATRADRLQTEAGGANTLEARYDAAGQSEHIGDRSFVWDAFGKLLEVREGQRVLARYRYNHRGERVEKIVGDKHTFYLYEDRMLLAELDGSGRISREYIYLDTQPVAVIDYIPERSGVPDTFRPAKSGLPAALSSLSLPWLTKAPSVTYLQGNHIGAIEMATDVGGAPVWTATYHPFGRPLRTLARNETESQNPSFEINLRLPGQYNDRETGLYYNDHRYYDPDRGRYLTPDPLGLYGGANGYVYAADNPARFIDPQGLVLFAFDGTSNTDDQTWLVAHSSSSSNVLQFAALYDDREHYISGVGTIAHDPRYGDIKPSSYVPGGALLPAAKAESADSAFNYSGPARIQRMVEYLNDEADFAEDATVVDLDIIGFSRGAAEARAFANLVAASTRNGWYSYKNASGKILCQKVNFRFMGLFDSVLSTNRAGGTYNLSIPREFGYVVQAVALNEHRGRSIRTLHNSWGAFPLESIMGGAVPAAQTRIERGFLGSHADIGGGFGANESQLAQVALSWMISQAKAAGLSMRDSPLLHTIIADPVIHDKSDNQYSTTSSGAPPALGVEDRDVHYLNGSSTKQMAMSSGGMSWSDTQQFISYLHATGPLDKGQYIFPLRDDFVKGTVDMQGYLSWLKQHGYSVDMEVRK